MQQPFHKKEDRDQMSIQHHKHIHKKVNMLHRQQEAEKTKSGQRLNTFHYINTTKHTTIDAHTIRL